ncbi:unnamed protein product [Amoebophrya sp. A25]|nr:unnamed protein product [Amoebophrya sp. A25]|eukprot:GSA25T00001133001.1
MSTATVDLELPSHWRVEYDPSNGRPYYYNSETGAVSWTKPGEAWSLSYDNVSQQQYWIDAQGNTRPLDQSASRSTTPRGGGTPRIFSARSSSTRLDWFNKNKNELLADRKMRPAAAGGEYAPEEEFRFQQQLLLQQNPLLLPQRSPRQQVDPYLYTPPEALASNYAPNVAGGFAPGEVDQSGAVLGGARISGATIVAPVTSAMIPRVTTPRKTVGTPRGDGFGTPRRIHPARAADEGENTPRAASAKLLGQTMSTPLVSGGDGTPVGTPRTSPKAGGGGTPRAALEQRTAGPYHVGTPHIKTGEDENLHQGADGEYPNKAGRVLASLSTAASKVTSSCVSGPALRTAASDDSNLTPEADGGYVPNKTTEPGTLRASSSSTSAIAQPSTPRGRPSTPRGGISRNYATSGPVVTSQLAPQLQLPQQPVPTAADIPSRSPRVVPSPRLSNGYAYGAQQQQFVNIYNSVVSVSGTWTGAALRGQNQADSTPSSSSSSTARQYYGAIPSSGQVTSGEYNMASGASGVISAPYNTGQPDPYSNPYNLAARQGYSEPLGQDPMAQQAQAVHDPYGQTIFGGEHPGPPTSHDHSPYRASNPHDPYIKSAAAEDIDRGSSTLSAVASDQHNDPYGYTHPVPAQQTHQSTAPAPPYNARNTPHNTTPLPPYGHQYPTSFQIEQNYIGSGGSQHCSGDNNAAGYAYHYPPSSHQAMNQRPSSSSAVRPPAAAPVPAQRIPLSQVAQSATQARQSIYPSPHQLHLAASAPAFSGGPGPPLCQHPGNSGYGFPPAGPPGHSFSRVPAIYNQSRTARPAPAEPDLMLLSDRDMMQGIEELVRAPRDRTYSEEDQDKIQRWVRKAQEIKGQVVEALADKWNLWTSNDGARGSGNCHVGMGTTGVHASFEPAAFADMYDGYSCRAGGQQEGYKYELPPDRGDDFSGGDDTSALMGKIESGLEYLFSRFLRRGGDGGNSSGSEHPGAREQTDSHAYPGGSFP